MQNTKNHFFGQNTKFWLFLRPFFCSCTKFWSFFRKKGIKNRSHYYRGPPFWPFLPHFGHFPVFLSFTQKLPFLLKIRVFQLFQHFPWDLGFSAIFFKNAHFSLFFIIFLNIEGFLLFSLFLSSDALFYHLFLCSLRIWLLWALTPLSALPLGKVGEAYSVPSGISHDLLMLRISLCRLGPQFLGQKRLQP